MSFRTRALFLLLLLAGGFTVVSAQLVQIQLVQHDHYLALANLNHEVSERIAPRRGGIYDVEGNVLAETQQLWDVRLDGREVKRPEQQLPAIARALALDPAALLASFQAKNRYLLLAQNVDDAAIGRVRALKFNCLKFEEHDLRSYPNNELAAHILGFVDGQGGRAGMEKQADRVLTGTPGLRWVERDGKNNEIAGYNSSRVDEPAFDGANLKLTIRLALQHLIEDQLDQIVQTYRPEAAHIIMLQPKTGEILAMASRPTFDPNNRKTFTPEALKNGCLTNVVEPGSIFKFITLAAALNERVVTLETPVFCENGTFHYLGKALHDDEPYSTLDVKHILVHSSNIGCAKVSLNYLGATKLHDYAEAFGFGARTNLLQNQGERAGILRPLEKWSGISVTRVAMGQEVGATPLQMAAAMAVVANGGNYVQPRLVSSISDPNGRLVKAYEPRVVRRVISEKAAAQITEALEAVVTEGTGKNAALTDYTVAGKTGTAQKFVNGSYSHTRHVSSFLGFMPAHDPEFVLLVMVDDPQTKRDHGAEVSAPIFAAIARQAAQILNIPPDRIRPPVLTFDPPTRRLSP